MKHKVNLITVTAVMCVHCRELFHNHDDAIEHLETCEKRLAEDKNLILSSP